MEPNSVLSPHFLLLFLPFSPHLSITLLISFFFFFAPLTDSSVPLLLPFFCPPISPPFLEANSLFSPQSLPFFFVLLVSARGR